MYETKYNKSISIYDKLLTAASKGIFRQKEISQSGVLKWYKNNFANTPEKKTQLTSAVSTI
jgi:hypothetical protein